MNKYLAISLMIVYFIVGIGIGFYMTPEYAAMQQENKSSMMDLGAADKNVDLRYIDGMIAHHMSAIYMLEQAQHNTKRGEVHKLAEAVIAADKKGIEELYALKREWYGNNRKVTNFQKVNLGKADEKFDLRLLNALIAHHEEAIDVARQVQTKSTRTETLQIASDVDASLSENMETLKKWREEWYGIK